MELRDLRVALRRHWLVALVAFGLCVALGAASAFSGNDRFKATATISVEPNADASEGANGAVTVAEFLLPALTQRLSSAPYFGEAQERVGEEFADVPVSVETSVIEGSGIVNVSVESPNADASAAWANALAETALNDDANLNTFLDVTLIEPAKVPSKAIASGSSAMLLASVVLGAIAAVFAAIVSSRARRALDPTSEVRSRLGVPVLATIPRVRQLRRSPSLAHVFNEGGEPTFFEAFRRLRTAVELELIAERPEVIAVTSYTAGEGKTTVATGLALALASVGHQTILLDADLRRPAVHTALGVPLGTEGLADFARADGHPELRQSGSLRYMTAGVPDRHPADATSLALPRALAEHRSPTGVVVLDAPPAEGIAETPLVLDAATHVILVIDASTVRLPELEQLVEQLQASGTRLLGAVVNRARKVRTTKKSYYYHVPVPRPSPATPADRAPRASADDLAPRKLRAASRGEG